jgi:Family of unknown function (DUF6177)
MSWPICDVATERVSVVIQNRPVVGLHRGLIDTIAAAGREERGVQVLTLPASRLTLAMRTVLMGEVHGWVVQQSPGRYFDGITGEPLHWSGYAFVPDEDGGSIPDAPQPAGQQLWVAVACRHERPPAAFGLAAEAACRAITGGPPVGWGTAEPVDERWRPAELSTLAAKRAPLPTFLTLVGGGERTVVGTLEIAVDPGGVTESATLVVGCPDGPEPIRAELATVADAVAREHPLSAFFAVCRPGRQDLTFAPYEDGEGDPIGVALGPDGLGATDIDTALALPGGRRISVPHRPAAWYDLGDGWPALAGLATALAADGKGSGKADQVE